MLENMMPVITGELTPLGHISGTLVSDMIITGNLSTERYDTYRGDYEVVPSMEDRMLKTGGKLLKRDVKVHRIPVYQTENTSGGYTVVIGG